MKTLFASPLKRVTVSEDGTYAVGPSTQVIQNYLSSMPGAVDAGMNYIAVYQCVRVLSNVFASVPLKLYRRRADGGKEEATDHPLYRVLHLQPNPAMTSFVWRKIAMRHLATWGNHYSEVVRDGIGRMQLWPINPQNIEVNWGDDGLKEYWFIGNGGRRKMRPGSIFHMQGQTTDGLIGSSPIGELRRTLGLAISAERYGTSVFDNGARPAVVLSHPQTLSQPAIDRLAGQMDAVRGSRNAGKTVVLEEGLSITPIGFPPEDAQFLGTRLTQHRLIYGAYGVPNHKVNDLEKATFSNIEHQALEFIQDGALPWYVNAEQEYATQLIEEDDIFAEFLVDGLLRGDAKSRAEAFDIQRRNGVINADEWRGKENMNPIEDGSGKTYWMPVNMTSGEVEEEEPAALEAPVSPPQLTVIKSAAVRCLGCNRLLAELASPPYRFTCPKCKSVASDEGKPTKSSNVELLTGLSDAIRSVAEPPVVNVAAPIVNVEAPEPAIVNVHTDSFVDAIADLKVMLAAPRSKRIERDANGRIVGLVEA